MYVKLLVPLDGSEVSRAALPHAVEVARAAHAAVVVVQTVEIVTEADSMTVPQRRVEAERFVGEAVASLQADGVELVTGNVVEGDAGRVIVETAEGEGVDLIVMASHGRSGVRRAVLGSVADYVIRHAPCPVLLVRAAGD